MVVLPCVQVPVLAACSVRACVRVCVWAFRLLKNLVCPSKSALFFSFSFVFSLLFVCLVRSLLLTIVFDSSIPACSMSSREGFFFCLFSWVVLPRSGLLGFMDRAGPFRHFSLSVVAGWVSGRSTTLARLSLLLLLLLRWASVCVGR